jgi:hypothetical protein
MCRWRHHLRVWAPCQREDAAVRIRNEVGRLVIGVNGLPRGNPSGEGDDWPHGFHLPYPHAFDERLPPPLKPTLCSPPSNTSRRRPTPTAAQNSHTPTDDGAQRRGQRQRRAPLVAAQPRRGRCTVLASRPPCQYSTDCRTAGTSQPPASWCHRRHRQDHIRGPSPGNGRA